MPKFDANITMMFSEVDFLDRFAAASAAGFAAVEYVSPYEYPAGEIARRLVDNNLTQALFNLPAGNMGAGELGIAILPDRVDEFRDGIATAANYAKATGCSQVNCLAGIAPFGADRSALEETLIRNLKFAANMLKNEGVRLLIEPINTIDRPGYFVNTSRHGLDLIDAVGSDNLFLQYDIYHMQIMEGDLARTIEANLGRIGHIQLADNPGRHEPGTGEINYPFVLKHLDRLGYGGWVGCEYVPLGRTEDGLGWMRG